jgi:hypothetical protein
MKKLFLIVPAVILLAAACNQQPAVQQNTQTTPSPAQTTPPPQNQTQTQPIDDMANRKIYTNTQFGFEFQYPSSWSVMSPDNSVEIYGSNADLASIYIKYYDGLKDLPLNPISHKPYDYFNQYVMDAHFFKEQKLMSLNSGTAESAVSVQDPSIKVVLIGGNGHFYEISYQIRYDQTWAQLEQIIQSFKFIN